MIFLFLQRRQLIQLGVPSSFIALCLDEGPGNPIRSPYVDYTKLYAVVSILVRCYDLSVKQQSSLEVRYYYFLTIARVRGFVIGCKTKT